MFSKVLIANRGAIACRIIRTLDKMGIASVAVYSDADRHSRHVRLAGEAVRIGPPPASQSYLDIDAILTAAKATGARGDPSRLWISFGEYGLRGSLHRRRHQVHRAGAVAHQSFRTETYGARAGREGGCTPGAGVWSGRNRRGSAKRGAPHRLSRHAEEHGRRRRHRPAACRKGGRSRFDIRTRAAPRHQQFQGCRHLRRKVRRARPAHRSADLWGWQRQRSLHLASAIVQRSAATRKLSKKRQHPDCRSKPGNASWQRPSS